MSISDKDRFKAILIGKMSCGKTCLLFRYVHDEWKDNLLSTIGVGYDDVKIEGDDGTICDLAMYDTAGQEAYNSLVVSYYRNTDVVFFCFSLDDETSFDEIVKKRHGDFDDQTGHSEDVIKILVGTKSDLLDEPYRSYGRYEEYSKEYGMKFFAVSSKNGNGFAELREYVRYAVLKKHKERTGRAEKYIGLKRSNVSKQTCGGEICQG